mmetsp:Transcript_45130/g.144555  ORF Transcript_45130/g.144555 Transcript_45130/m.144555 type:complete len:219 (+) Transcript_45130:3257-3913(+)
MMERKVYLVLLFICRGSSLRVCSARTSHSRHGQRVVVSRRSECNLKAPCSKSKRSMRMPPPWTNNATMRLPANSKCSEGSPHFSTMRKTPSLKLICTRVPRRSGAAEELTEEDDDACCRRADSGAPLSGGGCCGFRSFRKVQCCQPERPAVMRSITNCGKTCMAGRINCTTVVLSVSAGMVTYTPKPGSAACWSAISNKVLTALRDLLRKSVIEQPLQ